MGFMILALCVALGTLIAPSIPRNGCVSAQSPGAGSDPWIWTRRGFSVMVCAERQSDWIQPDRVLPFLLANLSPRHIGLGQDLGDILLGGVDAVVDAQKAGAQIGLPSLLDSPGEHDSGRTPRYYVAGDPLDSKSPEWVGPAYVSFALSDVEEGALDEFVLFEVHGVGAARGGSLDIERSIVRSSWGYQDGEGNGQVRAVYHCEREDVLEPDRSSKLAYVGGVTFSVGLDGAQVFTYQSKNENPANEDVIRVYSGGGAVEYIVGDEWKGRCIWRRLRYTKISEQPGFSVLELWGKGEAPLRYSFQFDLRGRLISRYLDSMGKTAALAVMDVEVNESGAISGFICESASVAIASPILPNISDALQVQKAHAEAVASKDDWFLRAEKSVRVVADSGYLLRRWIHHENGPSQFVLSMERNGQIDALFSMFSRGQIRVEF